MKYKTKSVIIGRKKREKLDDVGRPCFISLFSISNPHTSGEVPDKMLEFKHIHKVILTGLDVDYLLAGNDILIDNLEEIEIKHEDKHIYIKGKQKKD